MPLLRQELIFPIGPPHCSELYVCFKFYLYMYMFTMFESRTSCVLILMLLIRSYPLKCTKETYKKSPYLFNIGICLLCSVLLVFSRSSFLSTYPVLSGPSVFFPVHNQLASNSLIIPEDSVLTFDTTIHISLKRFPIFPTTKSDLSCFTTSTILMCWNFIILGRLG